PFRPRSRSGSGRSVHVVHEDIGGAETELQADPPVEADVERLAETSGGTGDRVEPQELVELPLHADPHAHARRPRGLDAPEKSQVEEGLPALVASENAQEEVRRDAIALRPLADAQS